MMQSTILRSTKSLSRHLHRTRSLATSTQPIPTPLHSLHLQLEGTMVSFADYSLPVLYAGENGGVMKEHLWCRSDGKASLFDVSHMGQIRWRGKDRVAFLERVTVGDIAGLKDGMACLSLLTNERGGIIDDTVITNAGDYVYMVVNGATKHGDMEHFREQMEVFGGDVSMEYLEDSMALVALQGPGAAEAVGKVLKGVDLEKMPFMSGVDCELDGVHGCRVTRCGYTGEDGFELAIPADHAITIAEALLSNPAVNPTGLGARDSLRLEAGLCLYGHDIDGDIKPTEAALGWTMGGPGSRRRVEGGFLGAEHILKPDGKFQKVTKKRVGLAGFKAPAREGAEIFDEEGNKVGVVTSGTFSPSLKKPIAMGYVESGLSKPGTEVMLSVRGKMQKAEVTKMPFVDSRYYRVPE
ncbi:hypothetical protein ACHAWO_011828 [Cyclotella atomus]|uniref:Aminomethyltransferase n=1 Tax=Cyclotella atomus TaxID=382360 RepID=A0ABD3PLK9_9STRA